LRGGLVERKRECYDDRADGKNDRTTEGKTKKGRMARGLTEKGQDDRMKKKEGWAWMAGGLTERRTG
jgi:hypothetical protein